MKTKIRDSYRPTNNVPAKVYRVEVSDLPSIPRAVTVEVTISNRVIPFCREFSEEVIGATLHAIVCRQVHRDPEIRSIGITFSNFTKELSLAGMDISAYATLVA